jgi:hypothetical protein
MSAPVVPKRNGPDDGAAGTEHQDHEGQADQEEQRRSDQLGSEHLPGEASFGPVLHRPAIVSPCPVSRGR